MIDEKPKSMSLSNFFIRKTAIKTIQPESIVEAVIKFQWRHLNETMKESNSFIYELTGFGQFKYSPSKLGKLLKKMTHVYCGLIRKKEKYADKGKEGYTAVTENLIKNAEESLLRLEAKIPIYESHLNRKIKWPNERFFRDAYAKRHENQETC